MLKLQPKHTFVTDLVIYFIGISTITVLFAQLVTPAGAEDAGWLSQNVTAELNKSRSVVDATRLWANHTEQCTNQTVWDGIYTKADNACVYQAKSFRLARMHRCVPNWYGSCNSENWISIDKGNGFQKIEGLTASSSAVCLHVVAASDHVVLTCGDLGVIDDISTSLSTHHLQNSIGLGASVSEAAVSNNGEWLAGELYEHGLFRLHLTDGSIQRITSQSRQRGYGMDPQYEFAISNDGQYVVAAGWNSDDSIYKVNESCGVQSTAYRVEWESQDENFVACPSQYLGPMLAEANGQGSSIYKISNMKFSDDGKTLELFEQLRNKIRGAYSWWVRLNLPDGSPRLEYLALGDSISSGEGDTAKDKSGNKYYRPGTDVNEDFNKGIPREKCHQSLRSYPYFLARSMNLNDTSKQWNSVACSGAKATDISSNIQLYEGQSQGGGPFTSKFESLKPRLRHSINREYLQAEALNEFIPGRVEQIEFVRKYKPKVITLTAGANDIDFSGKLKDCVSLKFTMLVPHAATCDWATSKLASLAGQIQNEYSALKSLYQELYEASGKEAKIYVIGYPNFMSKEEPPRCGANVGSLDLKERQMIVNATKYLNTVIEHAAKDAGVKYVDVFDSLNGGKLCDDGQEYVNGVILDAGKNELQESFHPNNLGHVMLTKAIREATQWQSLAKYNICFDKSNLCPNGDSAEKPNVPEYLGGKSKNSRSINVTRGTTTKGEAEDYTVEPGIFGPYTTVAATYFSEPTHLGTFTTDSLGGLNMVLTTPYTLPAGYHTLTLEGDSSAGEPLELTQTVEVLGSNPNDRDENGIADEKQNCGLFLSEDMCGLSTITYIPSVSVDKVLPKAPGVVFVGTVKHGIYAYDQLVAPDVNINKIGKDTREDSTWSKSHKYELGPTNNHDANIKAEDTTFTKYFVVSILIITSISIIMFIGGRRINRK